MIMKLSNKYLFLLFGICFLIPIAVSAQQATSTATSTPSNLSVNTPTAGFDITGTAPAGATVVLTTPSGARCETTAKSDGTFLCDTFNKSPEDGESITVAATLPNGDSVSPSTVSTAIRLAPDPERGFLREGIFGCSAGQYALPTGTLSAIGGVYVPVNDAAVTLNTGYLVYKECVLDGVIVATREAATAAIVKSVVNWINKGNAGNPQFVTNLNQYLLQHSDETALEFLKDYNLDGICAPYKQQIRVALARQYMSQTRNSQQAYNCSINLSDEDLNSALGGSFSKLGWSGFYEMVSQPQNTPFGAFLAAQDQLNSRLVSKEEERKTLLSYSGGFISPEDVQELPTAGDDVRINRQILTPGYVISRQLEQVSGSGFRQIETASEVDQIIGALFSGIGNQILTDTRGLVGITEAKRGRESYIEQLSSESSARVRQTATNAALTALNSSLTAENSYNSLKKEMRSILDKAISDLQKTETQCWNLIIPAVDTYSKQVNCTTSTNTTNSGGDSQVISTNSVTTCGNAVPYEVATSTQFSTEVITSDIQPLGNITEENINDSNTALTVLNRLVADIRNTSSQTIQRIALEKLDTLIATHAIHTAFDVRSAQEQRDNVKSTIESLVEDTITEWGSGNGWCNVNNSSVVASWLNQWRTDQ